MLGQFCQKPGYLQTCHSMGTDSKLQTCTTTLQRQTLQLGMPSSPALMILLLSCAGNNAWLACSAAINMPHAARNVLGLLIMV